MQYEFKSTKRHPFWYGMTATLGNGSQGSYTINFDASSWFEMWSLRASTSADAATDYRPNNFSVEIKMQSSGASMMNSMRIPQRMLAGPSNDQTLFPYPVLWAPNTVIQFDILNLYAGSNTITIALHGYKCYDLMNPVA